MNWKNLFYCIMFVTVFGWELTFFSFERGIDINMSLFVPFMILITSFVLLVMKGK